MAIHVTEQLRTFLLSILLGLGAGVLYDLLRAVRLRHPRLTAPDDSFVNGIPTTSLMM